MSPVSRIHNSLLLIRAAMFPGPPGKWRGGKTAQCLEPSAPDGFTTIAPEELHLFFATLGQGSPPLKPVTVFIPQVFPLTAPFLLSYLKRKGFSGCRVEVTHDGLAVTARR